MLVIHVEGAERGAYEPDEERPGLIARGERAQWTSMEHEIFNAVTRHWDRAPRTLFFSKRLRIVEAMLATFDAEVAK